MSRGGKICLEFHFVKEMQEIEKKRAKKFLPAEMQEGTFCFV